MNERLWLKQLRGKKLQAEIAEQCGVSVQMYSHIEKGLRRPSVKVAKRLGDALGFEWTQFFSDNTETTS